MTFTHRLYLMAFGLFTWSAAMFTAHEAEQPIAAMTSPSMAGIGAFLFVVALLPGRTARFS